MNIIIPEVKCSIVIEHFATNGSTLTKQVVTNATLQLCRNQQADCVLLINDSKSGKELKRFTLVRNRENYQLNTKFVHEGKSSLALKNLNLLILISNCPPNDLSLFLKCFALKCNYYSQNNDKHCQNSFVGNTASKSIIQTNQSKSSVICKISPLTSKDLIRNMALKDQTNVALESSARTYQNTTSPLATSKRVFNKRKLENMLDTIAASSPKTKKRLIQCIYPSPVKSLKVLNADNLTNEQHKVLSAVVHGQSLFFTGSAGTGKSYLLRFIISRLPPETTFVTASTGIAASHIGGITLHMFAGIPVNWLQSHPAGNHSNELTMNKACPKDIAIRVMRNDSLVQRWRQCRCLIIDEVSMVSGEYFDLLDQVARHVRNRQVPFGGIQLVLCGDFLQLPPITRSNQKRCYAFQSQAWRECITQCFELRKIQRQTDPSFIRVLQLLRVGRITDSVKSILIKTSQNELRKDGLIPTQLYTHRCDVERVNVEQMQLLCTEQQTYLARDNNPQYSTMLDSICPTPFKLELKVGAQVMLNKNIDLTKSLVNGLTGVVMGFESETDSQGCKRRLPKIRFINGIETTILPEKWSIKLQADGKTAYRWHLPLQLAWALSVHKSQGMTISHGVEISLAKVFESGQAYVALSRATSLENIKIIDFNPNNIIVDSEALNFYRQLKYIV